MTVVEPLSTIDAKTLLTKPSNENKWAEIADEITRLKAEKAQAVEEEEFEKAAALKRRIKVLEDTLSENGHHQGQYVAATASATLSKKQEDVAIAREAPTLSPPDAGKTKMAIPVREGLVELQEEQLARMKLHPDERDYRERTSKATRARGATDNLINGVPEWCFTDMLKKGPGKVLTERPVSLSYKFQGAIEDEKWEEGADFQTTLIVQADSTIAFGLAVAGDTTSASSSSSSRQNERGTTTVLEDGVTVHHNKSGTAMLSEFIASESKEPETAIFRVTVVKPAVPAGKSKLEAAQTVSTKQAFREHPPFYSFKSTWRFVPHPGGGTSVVRVVSEFRQFELMEFDALRAVSRAIEVENEHIRRAWSSAVALLPEKEKHSLVAVRKGEQGEALASVEETGNGKSSSSTSSGNSALARTMRGSLAVGGPPPGTMYEAAFEVLAPWQEIYNAILLHDKLGEFRPNLIREGSLHPIDEDRVLLRLANGMVELVSKRSGDRQIQSLIVTHGAGFSYEHAARVTRADEVFRDPLYRVSMLWEFEPLGQQQQSGESPSSPSEPLAVRTLVRRSMKDFKQLGHREVVGLPATLAEAAEEENLAIQAFFRRQAVDILGEEHVRQGPAGIPTSITLRANWAMRQMPELVDHAAQGHVLEVREMLEVRGANPNYIHIREDSWFISDSSVTFYEEITPLIAAAECGSTEVMKVLFNHPQLDANLVCCAFNEEEIYNYYTAYDTTISKRQPHAAALLRARGVLPSTSKHVHRPEFDDVRCRPKRAVDTEDDSFADPNFEEAEMPSWHLICNGNPDLAEALSTVADALSGSKGETMENRNKIFRSLITDWHPDRHSAKGEDQRTLATKVFQWLQVAKQWYLDTKPMAGGSELKQAPLPSSQQDSDRPTPPKEAGEYMHPSGTVFTVW